MLRFSNLFLLWLVCLVSITSQASAQHWTHNRVSLPVGRITTMYNGKAITYRTYDITDPKSYSTLPDTMFVTDDFGATWHDIVFTYGRGSFHFLSETDGYYAKVFSPQSASILHTTNGGQTWLESGCDGTAGSSGIYVRGDLIFAYTLSRTSGSAPPGCQSTNGGISWEQKTALFNAESFVFYSDESRVVCGQQNIIVDQDGNKRESDVATCILNNTTYSVRSDSSDMFAETMFLHPLGSVFAGTRIARRYNIKEKKYDSYGAEGMYVSIDSGRTLQRLNGFRTTYITFSPDGKFGVALAKAQDSIRRYILRTNDFGNTWGVQYLDDSAPVKNPQSALVFDSLHTLILCENGYVIRTSTGGGPILQLNDGTSDIADELNHIKFYVYPNPAQESLEVRGSENGSIELIDLMGRVVLTSDESRVDISGVQSGVYVISSGKHRRVVIINH